MKKHVRLEKDTMGEISVPADKYWGAQTQRSLENFLIGSDKMPIEVIHALALIKKAAAMANNELGVISKEKCDLICLAAEEVLAGKLDEHFPLLVWQTGSGTQTNMNVNEVISNRAIELAGGVMGSKKPIHPNDDVNHSQSSNCAFPTAMHIAAVLLVRKKLLPALHIFHKSLDKKAHAFREIVKIGRTHLMDAAPLTLGQEFSGYAEQVHHAIVSIEKALEALAEIVLGGTAVGTGLNAPLHFDTKSAEIISQLTKCHFATAQNKFAGIAAHDVIVGLSGALRQTAIAYLKIGNDIRWLGSGPRCGLHELFLPENEPGSSIMPGKVNPTQCEAMTMVAVQVMGNDQAIAIAGSQGNFELNAYKPVMIFNLLHSIHLLADVATNFCEKCLDGIVPNQKKIAEYVEKSLMLATALNESIGYEKAAQIVKTAYKEDISLKEAAVKLGLLTADKFDALINLKKMVHPDFLN
jgi:fumarate hydratase class II